LLKKKGTQRKLIKCAHIYMLPTQTKSVTCYKADPSSRLGGRPTKTKTAAVFTKAKIWSWVPEGWISALTDWLTDWLTFSCKVTLTLTLTLDLYLGIFVTPKGHKLYYLLLCVEGTSSLPRHLSGRRPFFVSIVYVPWINFSSPDCIRFHALSVNRSLSTKTVSH
jgi:hypothetical protein